MADIGTEIACGRRHFDDALKMNYRVVTNAGELQDRPYRILALGKLLSSQISTRVRTTGHGRDGTRSAARNLSCAIPKDEVWPFHPHDI